MSDSNRPDSMYIASVLWQIDWECDMKKGYLGYCDSEKYTIRISSSIEKEDIRRSVLLHEISHAIWFSFGFSPNSKKIYDLEEEVVSFFATTYYDTFVNNLNVAGYIFAENILSLYGGAGDGR